MPEGRAPAEAGSLGFTTSDVRGTLWVRKGHVLVSASTDCLENVER